MPTSMRSLVLAAGFAGALVTGAGAQDLSGSSSPLLQPEWTVEPARGGGAHVVGYLYNRNIRDAANVWLRPAADRDSTSARCRRAPWPARAESL